MQDYDFLEIDKLFFDNGKHFWIIWHEYMLSRIF